MGERIKESLNIKYNGSGNLTNGSIDGHDYESYLEVTTEDYQHPSGNERKMNNLQQQQVVNDVMVVTNAVTLNDPMQEVLSNETSVDDIELSVDINKPPLSDQPQQVNSKETPKDNDNVAHTDGINEDCTKPSSVCTASANEDGDQTKEPVEQVVQMLNLQINEEDHEDVTASAEQAQQPSHTTASSVPVTVTVNPVVVVTAQTLTANAEVPLVV